jgi:maleylacetate reductase
MTPFIHTPLPTRVLFGRGFSAKVGAEAERLGLHRPLVLTGRRQRELGRALAEKFGWPHWSGARMHSLSRRPKPRWTSFAPKARTAP